jgi:hypothetical protein
MLNLLHIQKNDYFIFIGLKTIHNILIIIDLKMNDKNLTYR